MQIIEQKLLCSGNSMFFGEITQTDDIIQFSVKPGNSVSSRVSTFKRKLPILQILKPYFHKDAWKYTLKLMKDECLRECSVLCVDAYAGVICRSQRGDGGRRSLWTEQLRQEARCRTVRTAEIHAARQCRSPWTAHTEVGYRLDGISRKTRPWQSMLRPRQRIW